MKTGALLINLGTPDAPTPRAVGRYLRQFLMDPEVVDLPLVARWPLVHLMIVPRRSRTSAEAYRKIWAEDSPLRLEHLELTRKVREFVGAETPVECGMRYGTPSIEEGLRKLIEAGVQRIHALPLYPQYSLAATRSSELEVRKQARRQGFDGTIDFLPAFYSDPGFIQAFAEVSRPYLTEEGGVDHVIFSYHGLPEHQIRRTDPSATHCLASDSCCERPASQKENRDCYRFQCFETTRHLSRALELKPGQYSVAFQSRLGRRPWVRPFTDHLYEELPHQGVRKVAVICPSFVADCLETLEEVAIRGRESFQSHGGTELTLVPSLNATASWVKTVAGWISRHAG